MGFNFINILKKVGHGAEVVGKDALAVAVPGMQVAAAIDPALVPVSALLSGVARGVLGVAKTGGAMTNTDKKDMALTMVESMVPVFLELLMEKTGHTVGDQGRFATGTDQVIEGMLNIYKSLGAVPVNTAPTPGVGDTGATTTTTTVTQQKGYGEELWAD